MRQSGTTERRACRVAGRFRAQIGAGSARARGLRYLKTVERMPGGGEPACEPAPGAWLRACIEVRLGWAQLRRAERTLALDDQAVALDE